MGQRELVSAKIDTKGGLVMNDRRRVRQNVGQNDEA